jgi:outer membrane receptor protein involved in Fe transport
LLAIRGITTGASFTTPTVGIVVDGLPFGSSTGVGGGSQAPDIDPSNLARVEVLRGPQGTLYGASSIGGILNFVTLDPSPTGASGRLGFGVSSVESGEGLGYEARGAVNLPLGGKAAIRASGFARVAPGYVDNLRTGQEGVNRSDSKGGRIAALFSPADDWTIHLNALIQHTHQNGSSLVDVGLGDLEQDDLPRTGTFSTTFQAYSAIVKGRLGTVNLTSLTGYSISSYHDLYDFSAFIPDSPLKDDQRTRKLSQEVRLQGEIGSLVNWLVGGFYTLERSSLTQEVLTANHDTGAITGSILTATFPSRFQEYAGFGNLTFNLSDRFDVQVGARQSWNRQRLTTIQTGNPTFTVRTREDSFTYLVTPRFRPSDHLMLYARFASGYRPGGPNTNAALYNLPPTFDPDDTITYEIGAKGDLIDRVLGFDASAFFMKWNNIQVQLLDQATGAGYTSNASEAKSEGFELALTLRPARGLTIDAWGVYNNAVLTEPFPATSPAVGAKGDRLPYSSRYSGNLSVNQSIPLRPNWRGFIGGSASLVGRRIGQFTNTAVRQVLPSYTRVDLRTGVESKGWTGTLYVNNLTDRRGVLGGGIGTFNPNSFNYIQPRTIGLSVSKIF